MIEVTSLNRVVFAMMLVSASLVEGSTVTFNLTSPQAACTVSPGATIDWSLSVMVSQGDNAGLAFVSVDLVQDPANPEAFDIAPALGVPSGMENFSRPAGISNPGEDGATTGYIGVQRGQPGQMNLVQIGGAQNTVGQAGTTTGTSVTVASGVGQGSVQIIARSTMLAPATLGTYRFSITNAVANTLVAIDPPPQPPAFWPVASATIAGGVAEFDFTVGVPVTCLKGDVNEDGLIDGQDLQLFIDCLFGSSPLGIDCNCADVDSDGFVTLLDAICFIDILLGDNACAVGCGGGGMLLAVADCNANGENDLIDIHFGPSQDCNGNDIPDECEIEMTSSAPGGAFYCTTDCAVDCNNNGVPDECEEDCNANGIPDGCDISAHTSNDMNLNGLPDECEPDCNANDIPDEMDIDPTDPDGNGAVSLDCNNDGFPDECEEDCNGNGVPDDCDVDSSDPDGDGQVSPDCNGNQFPDECDLTFPPPFGGLDCNANGSPDECDIAGGISQDCNANGFADECDIAAGISQDANANGIPDECEAQQSQSEGGDGSIAGVPLEAGETFYRWCLEQEWGPNAGCTCGQQFQHLVDKQRELGLPVSNPRRYGPPD